MIQSYPVPGNWRPAPEAGDTIDKPKGRYIDFRNIFSRSINGPHLHELADHFKKAAQAISPGAQTKITVLRALPIPANKSAEILTKPASPIEEIASGRLAYFELEMQPAPDAANASGLRLSLIMNLCNPRDKQATLSVVCPDSQSTLPAHELLNKLDGLYGKGLLNRVDSDIRTKDRSYQLELSQHAYSGFTLRLR